jgi:hypothetical protein
MVSSDAPRPSVLGPLHANSAALAKKTTVQRPTFESSWVRDIADLLVGGGIRAIGAGRRTRLFESRRSPEFLSAAIKRVG